MSRESYQWRNGGKEVDVTSDAVDDHLVSNIRKFKETLKRSSSFYNFLTVHKQPLDGDVHANDGTNDDY